MNEFPPDLFQSDILVAEVLEPAQQGLSPERQASFDVACAQLDGIAASDLDRVSEQPEWYGELLADARKHLLMCVAVRGNPVPSIGKTERRGFTDVVCGNQALSVSAYQAAGSNAPPRITCMVRNFSTDGYLAVSLSRPGGGTDGARVAAHQADRSVEGYVSAIDPEYADLLTGAILSIRRKYAFIATATAIKAAVRLMNGDSWQGSPIKHVLDEVPALGSSEFEA